MSLEHRIVGLVEDDPIMGESLVQRLSLEGTIVRWWTNGREALAEIERERPEAVVCDIRLPDMSGEEVFRAVADRTRRRRSCSSPATATSTRPCG